MKFAMSPASDPSGGRSFISWVVCLFQGVLPPHHLSDKGLNSTKSHNYPEGEISP